MSRLRRLALRLDRRRAARCLGLIIALACLPWASLVLVACFMELPPPLRGGQARTTVFVLDRDGRLLREVPVGSGAPENPVKLSELSPWVVPALLAAEDKRFFQHPGVDPLAVTRAVSQLLSSRRVVSGASTLTQQLARAVRPVPRTALGKMREMALALRLEASLSKSEILEAYLSRVEFGPNLTGLGAASRHYFGKPASALDLSEASALVAIPRGPSLYDPRRRPQLLERRRLRVLSRMAELGLATPDQVARAELTPIRIVSAPKMEGAEHLSFALAARVAAEPGARERTLRTSLDAALQREAERVAAMALPSLDAHDGGAIALVVLDNATSEVLAYVGSPSYFDAKRQGANDGVTARRQPGSTLKPFVYAAAMEQLGYGPATLLHDLPRDYALPDGNFSPRNYDQHVRGPVLLRQALGSSLNLPALEVAARLGPARVLAMLHRFGFESLDRDAEHYGVGLALGDGEVTLLELAGAYAALARGGESMAPRLRLARSPGGGEPQPLPTGTKRRVLSPEQAALLSDMLSDDSARAAGFGRDSALNLPFPVAAKTGTSKGYRDNWAVGYTHEVTVAVWVGNFDGTPLRDASGITVAGPAFHELMLAAMRGRVAAPLFDRSLLAEVEVCTLSGQRPGRACQHRRLERFVRGREPSEACRIDVLIPVDAEGRESAARCASGTRRVERYPAEFRAWAEQAGRPLVSGVSPRCPPEAVASAASRVTFPRAEQTFALDADGPARQEIVLSAASDAARLRFVVDGRISAPVSPPFRLPWRLTPGAHRVEVDDDGRRSASVTFEVVESGNETAASTLGD